MSRIIAVFNQAGGIPKTTLTQNLGYQIAQWEQRDLVRSGKKAAIAKNYL